MVEDGRRVRGDRTRSQILNAAVGVATVRGVDGFSLSELSTECAVPKATIAALFGDKEQLQIAIIHRARQILDERLLSPVACAAPGAERLVRLGEVWFDYLSDPELRGGCFFAAASFELDARPGPLRKLIASDMARWVTGIGSIIEDGQTNGEFSQHIDTSAEALVFFSLGVTTNSLIQLGATSEPAEVARRAWATQVERIRTPPDTTPGDTR